MITAQKSEVGGQQLADPTLPKPASWDQENEATLVSAQQAPSGLWRMY